MKPNYFSVDANNQPQTDGQHQAVRVEQPLLAHPIFVTAQRSPERMTHEEAMKWAEGLTINGWSWRLPTAEEAFLICDRTIQDPALPKENFPDCEGEYIWTSTPTAWNAGAAWVVFLSFGFSGWSGYSGQCLARAVRAGQF
jgi:hypothetical protein